MTQAFSDAPWQQNKDVRHVSDSTIILLKF